MIWMAGLLVAAGIGCSRIGGTRADPSSSRVVQAYVTTGDRAKLLSREADVRFGDAQAGSVATIDVDETVSYQEIVGFGASLTDASAWLIQHKLTPPQREALLQELFGREPGVGFSFVRLDIGASDFSLRHYSYDDMPAGQTDPTLANFSIAPDRDETIPILKRALAINPRLTVMASPWSAPGWMKTTGSMIKGTLRPDAYAPFAEYFRKFILGGCGNCRGVVTINSSDGSVTRNEEYYAFGHVSRFVRPGARRVASSSGFEGIESVAFRNADDGSKALVVVNANAQQKAFLVASAGRTFRYTLPAAAVATFRWN
jgi:O-glycosyl hydrolase